jgi:hypothetical protein
MPASDSTAFFRSKVDRKLTAIGVAMPGAAILALALSPKNSMSVWWLALTLTALITVFVLWVMLSTYYEFQGEVLVAHSGPFSWRVPLKDITAVRESNSARSGPALSMDRLEIGFGVGRVLLISPADKPGFLAALHRRAPRLAPPLA